MVKRGEWIEDVISGTPESAKTKPKSRGGGRLLDIILGAAKGYSSGVQSDIPESGIAAGLMSGLETGQAMGEQRQKQKALRAVISDPEFMNLPPQEKAYALRNPDDYLKGVFARGTALEEKRLALGADKNKREEDRAFQAEQRRLDRESREHLAGLVAGRQAQERADKRAEEDKALEVPGYQRTGQVRPKPDEAKSARDAVASLGTVRKDVNDLRRLIKQYGSFELAGPEAAEMSGIARSIQLNLKGLYDLGVLQPADLRLLESMVKDPTSPGSMFTFDSSRLQALDTLLSRVESRTASKLGTMGYQDPNKPPEFDSEDAVRAANLPDGTEVIVGGQRFIWRAE